MASHNNALANALSQLNLIFPTLALPALTSTTSLHDLLPVHPLPLRRFASACQNLTQRVARTPSAPCATSSTSRSTNISGPL